MRKLFAVFVLVFLASSVVGCRKYETPVYEDVDTSETAFVVPLEGDIGNQASIHSVDYLNQHKVAAKRIRITREWFQEGYSIWRWQGKWIPTIKVIKVNRSPVSRQWTAAKETGTSASDQAIRVESKDSVGFGTGITCTAFIREEDTALFLNRYPSQSLAEVMDTEIRARIQKFAFEAAASEKLNKLRGEKKQIMENIEKGVVEFFAEKGITIQSIGMFGGFTYDNPEVQNAIDETFIAQQLKVVNEAEYKAEIKELDRVKKEAKALADKKVTEAEGRADAITNLAKAAEEAGKNKLYYDLERLKIEKLRYEKWDGTYPEMLLSTGESILAVQENSGGDLSGGEKPSE